MKKQKNTKLEAPSNYLGFILLLFSVIHFWAYGVFILIPKDILNSWTLALGVKWKIISFFSQQLKRKMTVYLSFILKPSWVAFGLYCHYSLLIYSMIFESASELQEQFSDPRNNN